MRLDPRIVTISCLVALTAGCAAISDKGPIDTAGLELEGGGSADGSGPFRGAIALGDRVSDSFDRHNAYDVWDLTVDADCGDAFFDLASREGGDTWLGLYRFDGRRWRLVDLNDDCYSGTLNSCLEGPLEAGRYRILATSYEFISYRGRPSFAYELGIVCRDEPPAEQACGSRGLAPCADGFFCAWAEEAMCGATDRPGVCQPIPEICTREFRPVCGCDGNTYSNACTANASGVSVASAGECAPPTPGPGEEGGICGGIAGFVCNDGLVCDRSDQLSCDIADGAGVCTRPSEFCPTVYAPECGCNGVTYTNRCNRVGAGEPLAYDGTCR